MCMREVPFGATYDTYQLHNYTITVSGQGLGDRFLQFLIGLVYALRTHGKA